MKGRTIEPIVLNAGGDGGRRMPLAPLAARLRTGLAAVIASHADPVTGDLDYGGIRAAADFGALVDAARGLASGSPDDLPAAEDQIAFWSNLYNALTLHAVVALDIRRSVGEVHEFFLRVRYDVGGDHFSLADIEHGVLRQNQPSRNQPTAVFAASDPRLRWLVSRLDPRIHFALTCGTRSCPPIRAFDAARLDVQLDLATRAFVNGDVEVDEARRSVTLSRIFHWYEVDFGDVLGFVLGHLDAGPTREWLSAHRGDATVVYREYDWAINSRGEASSTDHA